MNLEYELVEENFDDTTHIRTMSEEAVVPGRGSLIRTTIYTPHHITASVVFIPNEEDNKRLFDTIGV